MKQSFVQYFQKISQEWKLILFLFVISRIWLTASGVFSRLLVSNYLWGRITPPFFFKPVWLDIWGAWDSWWYLEIAEYGYTEVVKSPIIQQVCCDQNNYGFFPLYPLITNVATYVIPDVYIAALVVSNIALILSAFFLYKLVLFDFSKKIALLAIVFFFLLPTGFILSSVFSESLFLLFSLMSFYYARQKKWAYAGVSGYFTALARPTGFLLVLPLLYIFIRYELLDKQLLFYRTKVKLSVNSLVERGIAIASPLLGILTFCFYTFYKTGDFLKYFHEKQIGWSFVPTDPLYILFLFLLSQNFYLIIVSVYTFSLITFLLLQWKRIPFEYIFYTLILIFFSMFSGPNPTLGMLRFSSTFFILPITFGLFKPTKMPWSIGILTVLQTILMMLYVNGILII